MSERFNPFLPGEARRQLVRAAWGAAWTSPGFYVGYWLRNRYGLRNDLPALIALVWIALVQLAVFLWQDRRGRSGQSEKTSRSEDLK